MPHQPAEQNLMGDILIRQTWLKNVLSAFVKAREFGDASVQINFNIAYDYLALGGHEDTKICFDLVLDIDPKNSVSH